MAWRESVVNIRTWASQIEKCLCQMLKINLAVVQQYFYYKMKQFSSRLNLMGVRIHV